MVVIASANDAIRARMTLPPMEPTKSPTLPGMSTMTTLSNVFDELLSRPGTV
jgi:hypothetical protein